MRMGSLSTELPELMRMEGCSTAYQSLGSERRAWLMCHRTRLPGMALLRNLILQQLLRLQLSAEGRGHRPQTLEHRRPTSRRYRPCPRLLTSPRSIPRCKHLSMHGQSSPRKSHQALDAVHRSLESLSPSPRAQPLRLTLRTTEAPPKVMELSRLSERLLEISKTWTWTRSSRMTTKIQLE